MNDYAVNIPSVLLFLGLIAWETVRPCKRFPSERRHIRLRHGAVNIFVGLLAAAVSFIIFLLIWRGVEHWKDLHQYGLIHLIPASSYARPITALLLLDLWTYWWHRMNHRIPFLWRFHRTHHSDPWMDVTTAKRFHPGELVLSWMLRIPIIILSGVELWHVVLYDSVAFSVVLFHHSNIALPTRVDQLLRLLIPTPIMHKIHHSRIRTETNSNYTALLSIWDRIFGTFRMRSDWHNISFGLDGYDAADMQTPTGLLKTPFIKKAQSGCPNGISPCFSDCASKSAQQTDEAGGRSVTD